MKRILVERSPREGGDWVQMGPSMKPGDRLGSGTAFWDSEYVTVLFGWDGDVPRVWMDDSDSSIDLAPFLRAHPAPIQGLLPLADLRSTDSFEMDGPHARWRRRLIDD